MGHIHGNSEYDYTVSAMIVHERKVLLLFHHKMHLWLPPAGHVELDETPIEALHREIEEETGLTKAHLRLVLPYDDNLAFQRDATNTGLPVPIDMDVHTINDEGHRHIDLMYLMTSDTADVRPEEGGAEQLAWYTLDEIAGLSPMPRKVYSIARYALAKAGELHE